MYSSKHLSNVALFPLCDTRGVLIDALCDTTDAPATRGDALVFAWRMELPESINVAEAANALLVVAMTVPRKAWTRQQLLIVRELMVLAGREGSVPDHSRISTASEGVQPARQSDRRPARKTGFDKAGLNPSALTESQAAAVQASDTMAAHNKQIVDRLKPRRSTSSRSGQADKESKAWWKLVGKQEPEDEINRQRKTRKERVSREP